MGWVLPVFLALLQWPFVPATRRRLLSWGAPWRPVLEGIDDMNHPWPMTRLRHRIDQWIRHPAGIVAVLCLLLSLVMTGLSTVKVHAHADGDHAHQHAAQWQDGASSGQAHPASPGPAGDMALHAHDVCTTVPALTALPAMLLGDLPPMAPNIRAAAPPPPSEPRAPPHRPPIA